MPGREDVSKQKVWGLDSRPPLVRLSGVATTSKPPRQRDELNVLIKRFCAAGRRSQLELMAFCAAYLSADPRAPRRVDEQIEACLVALDCLDRVADLLQLPAGQPPTLEQYRTVEAKLPMRANAVTRA